jgi:hypothetical protein
MPGTVYVQAGQDWLVDKLQSTLAGDTGVKPEWLGWGTGITDPVVGNTGLETAAAEARTQGTLSQPTADTSRCVGTITCAETGKTISEVGLFTASTAGVLIIRATFTGIPLLVGDRIEFTVDLTIT